VKNRVDLTATLSSLIMAVSSAGRPIAFERQVHGKWKRLATVHTDAAGRAQAKLAKAKTSLKLRARWAGSVELAGAASKTLTLR
jgi:5-hydroxyisourate hydrolase-like protein (transthyretin family)